jgi:ubiquinone/menaquinone biosynthesis C-methylase UbiE
MAVVFMKWLETTPRKYDRGIQLLTLGRLTPLKGRIASSHIQPNNRVLEIGCGTGTLSILIAERGAKVTAIDVSPSMLSEAECNAVEAGLADAITFHQLDVTELSDHFEPHSYDTIVSTLVFSEFPPEVLQYALKQAAQLLKPGGQLLVVDEIVPESAWKRFIFRIARLPLAISTWVLTRATTTPLQQFSKTLTEAGFAPTIVESQLGGSLQLIEAHPVSFTENVKALWKTYPQLRHRVTVRTLLMDLWSLMLNRFIPPYPKFATGLYRVGHPDPKAPVLVTGNYELTVRRLVRELDGRADCWLLVANSRGINVWCAASGGHFTAEDVIAALKSSGVMEVVDHHALILPQLCATGIDGWKIRKETRWGVHWGPVRAHDIPAYLAARRKKTDEMHHVQFPLRDRLEMTTVAFFFYGMILAILALIFWRSSLTLLLGLMALISYFYGVFLPWLPGRDGLAKGVTLAGLTLAGLWGWSIGWGHLTAPSLLYWSLGLGYLAFFIGGEFQGMSPLMRGEQANWNIEGLVGVSVLAIYGVSRLFLGV